MDIVNAIAKVRFSPARPQRIHLHKGETLVLELLCMEAGQKLAIHSGERAYYVVTGQAELTSGGQTTELPTGQLAGAGPEEAHTIANAGEGRLVVLAVEHPT